MNKKNRKFIHLMKIFHKNLVIFIHYQYLNSIIYKSNY